MKKSLYSSILSLALVFLTLFCVLANPVNTRADDQYGYVNTSSVRLRSGAGTDYGIVIDGLPTGANVKITGTSGDWYKVNFGSYTGYIYSDYVTLYNPKSDPAFENQIAAFPESYKLWLRNIHSIYPNYKFEKDDITDTFNSCVDCEYEYKVMDKNSTDNSWLGLEDGTYNWTTGTWGTASSGWTSVSWEVCAYYMDPRNFLDPKNIYMYLKQLYSDDQTVDEVRKILAGTFMATTYTPKKGNANDEKFKGDYAQVIVEAAKQSGVSAYFIATNILAEQGTGGSVLTNGKYPGYEGYYNFYNYDVYGTTEAESLKRGIERAKREGWDNIYDCIVKGAQIFARDFLKNNQDTYFYKDYNLLNGQHNGMYYNQYAGAVAGPKILANKLSNYLGSYTNMSLTFRIPVYTQMPDSAYSMPLPNNKLNNYFFTNITGNLSPAFDKFTRYYSMSVGGNTSIDVYVPGDAAYTGRSSYPLNAGQNTVNLTVRSETGYSRAYTLNISASSSCTLTVNARKTEFQKSSSSSGGNSQGSSSSGNNTKQFDDVTNPSASYYKPIYWASSHGYIFGYKNSNNFGPGDDCTRGQFVTILWRMAGRPAPSSTDNPFSDVSPSASYYKAILWAVEQGIIVGYNDGTFRPSNTVTRLNVVVMLWRMTGRPSSDISDSRFPDVDTSVTGYKAVYWGEETGVVRGASNGYFNPYNNCTRSQIVTFFYRYSRDILGQDVSVG